MGNRIIEEARPHLEIYETRGHGIIVKRHTPGEKEDWLGRLVAKGSVLVATTMWHGSDTWHHKEFKLTPGIDDDINEAAAWLASLSKDERESDYRRQQSVINEQDRERSARDRRERPWWYNDDGSHIGINSNGTFRSSRYSHLSPDHPLRLREKLRRL